jgi:hypothetical protein
MGRSFMVVGAISIANLWGCVRPIAHSRPAHPRSHAHAAVHSHAPGEDSACVCTLAQARNGWCAACQVGYVASVAITSADLFDAIDAHGHDFIPASIECQQCQSAIASDGHCESCRLGFYRGQLYCSKLSYTLARGRLVAARDLSCSTCSAMFGRSGWCDSCGVGVVGNTVFGNPEHHEKAAAEFATLQTAIAKLSACEACAIVMFTGGECPVCTAAR